MITRNNFAEIHTYCGKALKAYKNELNSSKDFIEFESFQTKWLLEYKRMFCFIIIKPKGLPHLLMPHPKRFFNIRKFYELYLNINDGITSDEEMENMF